MKRPNPGIPEPDPAAIFAAALSLWTTCNELEKKDPATNLSDVFDSIDALMRVAMRLATKFETWACTTVDFDRLSGWWPYILQDQLGPACLDVFKLEGLPDFDDEDALKLALRLNLPLKPLAPVWIHAANPLAGAFFRRISIRSMREATDGSGIEPFTRQDDAFDPKYRTPFYGIYGVDQFGNSEHLADKDTLDEALAAIQHLIPGLVFG